MSAMPLKYIRLARPAAGIGLYYSLWLADDHLLQVKSTGWSENYQQFLFSDVRGIFVGGSKRRANWNIAWGVFLGLWLLIALANWDDDVPYISLAFCAVCLIVMAVNTFVLGPTCRVYLVTRIQTVRLSSLVRFKNASKVLDRIQPLIAASQAGAAEATVPSASPAPTP